MRGVSNDDDGLGLLFETEAVRGIFTKKFVGAD